MKTKSLLFLLLIFFFTPGIISSEAQVLPAGTVIILPNSGESLVLSETFFLLNRLDMEGAVLCQEERILLRTDNQALSSENEKLVRKAGRQKIALIALPIGTSLLSFLISYLIARAGR